MRRPATSQRGFTLIEMLISTALFGLVMGALLTLVDPARDLFVTQPEVQDLQQRLRFGVMTLQGALANAGASMTTGSFSGVPLQVFGAIRPNRIGDRSPDPSVGVMFRPDTVSVLHIPADAAPARIRSVSGTSPLGTVELEPNCRGVDVCGFTVGSRVAATDLTGRAWFGTVRRLAGTLIDVESLTIEASMGRATGAVLSAVEQSTFSIGTDRPTGTSRLMIYDGHLSDAPVLDHVVRLAFEYFGDSVPPVLLEDDVATTPWLAASYGPSPPGVDIDNAADTWPTGENCTFAVVGGRHVSRLASLGGAALPRMPPGMFTDGPWCPDAASANRFDADLLRVRRMVVVVRVQASFAWMRGPSSLRFLNGGSGRRESRLVPDQEIRFGVTLRNLLPGANR
jgi:prepilin-type N-terminal cleavage/methylation domain-containing protein